VIRARGLAKTYARGRRAFEALLDVDFDVYPGACLGLLGRNGSGKTTSIGLVLGLLAPSGGTVEVFGGRPGRRAARARTGYVPEEGRRFGSLTGTETVALFAALQGVRPRRERRRRIAEALDLVGLDERARRARVSTYSRGMARRLALATAWVHRPELLVLDEPTSGLDPIGTEDVIALLDRHRREGGATLISTHDRVTAEGACDEILLLREGLVAARGTPSELLRGDESASLASLLRGPTDA
jgi:ABC-2 type transport system ATP-binding protein